MANLKLFMFIVFTNGLFIIGDGALHHENEIQDILQAKCQSSSGLNVYEKVSASKTNVKKFMNVLYKLYNDWNSSNKDAINMHEHNLFNALEHFGKMLQPCLSDGENKIYEKNRALILNRLKHILNDSKFSTFVLTDGLECLLMTKEIIFTCINANTHVDISPKLDWLDYYLALSMKTEICYSKRLIRECMEKGINDCRNRSPLDISMVYEVSMCWYEPFEKKWIQPIKFDYTELFNFLIQFILKIHISTSYLPFKRKVSSKFSVYNQSIQMYNHLC